ncbi:DUF3768 domain-containing protein [Novosphingobium sp. HII-3]|uniref:DUF3768 domain-containing protein n=1 Tax=Novosphingobium sp. HII-3 TaxID=2075565 RepID=UPI000CDA15CB|nr:DUF3768 domain-containing protein [Novosphingobium sp. HII-3]
MMTSNLLAKLSDGSPIGRVVAQAKAMKAARSCTFKDDSPERDFASFEIEGVKAFLKVDYFDVNLQFGSEDPADASITRRVVTIMAAEDY